jgi:hypothetical protein
MYNLEHTSEYTEENQVCGHLQNGWNKCHHLQFKIFAGFRNAAKNTQNSVTYTSMMSSAGDWCTLRSLLAHGRHNTVRRPLHALQIVAAVTAFSFIPISSSFCSHPALQRSLSWQHNTWLEVFTLCENHSRGLNKYCAGIISFIYHQFSILNSWYPARQDIENIHKYPRIYRWYHEILQISSGYHNWYWRMWNHLGRVFYWYPGGT